MLAHGATHGPPRSRTRSRCRRKQEETLETTCCFLSYQEPRCWLCLSKILAVVSAGNFFQVCCHRILLYVSRSTSGRRLTPHAFERLHNKELQLQLTCIVAPLCFPSVVSLFPDGRNDLSRWLCDSFRMTPLEGVDSSGCHLVYMALVKAFLINRRSLSRPLLK